MKKASSPARRLIAGLLLFIIAEVAMVVALTIGVVLMVPRAGERFRVPGTLEMEIPQPGRYLVWHHNETFFQGRSYSLPEGIPTGTEIHVRVGNDIPVKFQPHSSTTATDGHESRHVVGRFTVDTPGDLAFEVLGTTPESVFSVSRDSGGRVTFFVLATVAIGNTAGMVGVGIAIWGIIGLVKHESRHSRQTQAQ